MVLPPFFALSTELFLASSKCSSAWPDGGHPPCPTFNQFPSPLSHHPSPVQGFAHRYPLLTAGFFFVTSSCFLPPLVYPFFANAPLLLRYALNPNGAPPSAISGLPDFFFHRCGDRILHPTSQASLFIVFRFSLSVSFETQGI